MTVAYDFANQRNVFTVLVILIHYSHYLGCWAWNFRGAWPHCSAAGCHAHLHFEMRLYYLQGDLEICEIIGIMVKKN